MFDGRLMAAAATGLGMVKAHCRVGREPGVRLGGQGAGSRKRAVKRGRALSPAVSDMAVL